jgi:CarboxypepD_reg-like domain
MGKTRILRTTVILIVLVLFRLVSSGQVRISGTIFDRSARFGLPGVSVMSNSGAGAVSDSAGHYTIVLPINDSISFSYQGKATMKFAVKEINNNRPYDMSLHVDTHVLPTVVVTSMRLGDYLSDSLKNREEYRKVFDYSPEYLSGGGTSGMGVGVNLDALFSMKKIKRMENFRRFMEREEREKYIDHRFNKALVKKITGLTPPALDTFMVQYRPSYEMLLSFENEYEYYKLIKDWSQYFLENWNRDHPNRN